MPVKKTDRVKELIKQNDALRKQIEGFRKLNVKESKQIKKQQEKSFIVTLQNEVRAVTAETAATFFMNDYLLSSIKYSAEIELCVEGDKNSENILVSVDKDNLHATIVRVKSCDAAECECTCHVRAVNDDRHCNCEYDHCGNCDNGWCVKCPICNCSCEDGEREEYEINDSESCHCNCSNEDCVECDDHQQCCLCSKCQCNCDESES